MMRAQGCCGIEERGRCFDHQSAISRDTVGPGGGSLRTDSTKKLFAILLYIIYNAQCSRDELVIIFWGNIGEESARQNLRNAIYRLKKLLGQEMLMVDHQKVSLGKEVSVLRDTDGLVADDGNLQILELEDTVFLNKLYLRGTPEFDKWVLSTRAAYEKIIAARLESNMRELLRTGNPSVEVYAQKLLSIFPYHEEAVRALIQHYTSYGLYSDAIRVYTRLVDALKTDLGLQPEASTQEA